MPVSSGGSPDRPAISPKLPLIGVSCQCLPSTPATLRVSGIPLVVHPHGGAFVIRSQVMVGVYLAVSLQCALVLAQNNKLGKPYATESITGVPPSQGVAPS